MTTIRCYFPTEGGDGAIRGFAKTRWGWVWLCVRGPRSQRWLCRLRLMRVEIVYGETGSNHE